jgi:sporulation protein YabP
METVLFPGREHTLKGKEGMAMVQEKQTLPHKLSLDEREKLTMTGAREIIHFDEEMTKLVTDRGAVSVYGRGLKLKTLSLEGGKVSITGQIDGVIYDSAEKSGGRRGFWK